MAPSCTLFIFIDGFLSNLILIPMNSTIFVEASELESDVLSPTEAETKEAGLTDLGSFLEDLFLGITIW